MSCRPGMAVTGYHSRILLASKRIWAPGGGGSPGVNSRRCGPLGACLGAATTHGELGTLDPNGGTAWGLQRFRKAGTMDRASLDAGPGGLCLCGS